MPLPSTVRPPLPKDEDEFENIVRDALCLRFSDPSFKRYGRRGQKQHGIDGLAEYSGPNAGLAWQATLQQTDVLSKLKRDLDELDRSPLHVRHLLFCVGLPRDANLQNEVTALSSARINDRKCSVEIVFWDDLYLDLCSDRGVFEKHFPWLVGPEPIHEQGLMMLGFDVIFDADFVAMAGDRWTVRIRGFLSGDISETARYIADFDTIPPAARFIASERVGQARQLTGAPTLAGHLLTLQLNPAAPRTHVDRHGSTFALDTTGGLIRDRKGMRRIRGLEAAIQLTCTTLGRTLCQPGQIQTAGSRCSTFFHSQVDKSVASRLFGLELARLAYIPVADLPLLDFIRTVTCLRIDSREPDGSKRIIVQAELQLEGHGLWTGKLAVFVGHGPASADTGPARQTTTDPREAPQELSGEDDSNSSIELENVDEIRDLIAFSERLEVTLAEWDDKRDDLEFGVFGHKSSEALRIASKNAQDFIRFVGQANDTLISLIGTFDSLINRAFQQTFDTDGTLLSSRRSSYFIQRWSSLYKDILDWGLQWELAGAPQEFQRLFEIQRQKALSFADEVRTAPKRLREELQDAIDHPGRDVHVSLTLDCEDGHAEELDRETRRALSAIDPELARLMEEP